MAHFDFAVLRLSPDPTRGESINIGLVIFLRGGVDIRTGEVLTRGRAVFPRLDKEILKDSVDALARFGSVDLPSKERHRTLSQFGVFQLGELGQFTTDDADEGSYEEQVARLMGTFVRSPRRLLPDTPRVARLVTDVRRSFRREGVLAPLGDSGAISEHMIVPDWPLPGKPSLKADLALQNGVMRICEIVELQLEDDAQPPSALFTGVVTLDVAQREVGAQETVFAYRASGPTSRIEEALGIAAHHTTKFVDWEVTQERETFLHDWIMAARPNERMKV